MKKGTFRTLGALLIALSFVLTASAQDPQYSQFYSNPVMLNPAFTGSSGNYRIAMNYRAQWLGIPGSYKQIAVSYDQPVYFLNSAHGLGVTFNSDVAGEGNLTKLNFLVNYAYHLKLDDSNSLLFGVSGGLFSANVDFYRLRFPDQLTPDGFTRPTDEPGNILGNPIRPDVNAGIAYFNEYAWLGFSVHHITEPEEVFYDNSRGIQNDVVDTRLPRRYQFTGGVRIPIGAYGSRREMTLTPTFLAKFQGEFWQVDAGLYLNIEPMVFGLWYRHRDAMIGLIGVNYGPFSFGYSYDYTISTLNQGNTSGSHEISLVLQFEHDRKNKMKHRSLPCPKF